MRYLLCLLPPVAVIFSTKNPLVWVASFVLTLLLYFPGVIHAVLVVSNYNANKRTDRVVKATLQRD